MTPPQHMGRGRLHCWGPKTRRNPCPLLAVPVQPRACKHQTTFLRCRKAGVWRARQMSGTPQWAGRHGKPEAPGTRRHLAALVPWESLPSTILMVELSRACLWGTRGKVILHPNESQPLPASLPQLLTPIFLTFFPSSEPSVLSLSVPALCPCQV